MYHKGKSYQLWAIYNDKCWFPVKVGRRFPAFRIFSKLKRKFFLDKNCQFNSHGSFKNTELEFMLAIKWIYRPIKSGVCDRAVHEMVCIQKMLMSNPADENISIFISNAEQNDMDIKCFKAQIKWNMQWPHFKWSELSRTEPSHKGMRNYLIWLEFIWCCFIWYHSQNATLWHTYTYSSAHPSCRFVYGYRLSI